MFFTRSVKNKYLMWIWRVRLLLDAFSLLEVWYTTHYPDTGCNCSLHSLAPWRHVEGRTVANTHELGFSWACCVGLFFCLIDIAISAPVPRDNSSGAWLHMYLWAANDASTRQYIFLVLSHSSTSGRNIFLVDVSSMSGGCTLVHKNAKAICRSGLARFDRNRRRAAFRWTISASFLFSLTPLSLTLNICDAAGVTDDPLISLLSWTSPRICFI